MTYQVLTSESDQESGKGIGFETIINNFMFQMYYIEPNNMKLAIKEAGILITHLTYALLELKKIISYNGDNIEESVQIRLDDLESVKLYGPDNTLKLGGGFGLNLTCDGVFELKCEYKESTDLTEAINQGLECLKFVEEVYALITTIKAGIYQRYEDLTNCVNAELYMTVSQYDELEIDLKVRFRCLTEIKSKWKRFIKYINIKYPRRIVSVNNILYKVPRTGQFDKELFNRSLIKLIELNQYITNVI